MYGVHVLQAPRQGAMAEEKRLISWRPEGEGKGAGKGEAEGQREGGAWEADKPF